MKQLSVFFLILLFLANCKSIHQEVKATSTDIKPPINHFVVFLKKRLPLIHSKMTFADVNQFLEFDKRFNGIILSEGSQDAFNYYYELIGHELVLTFDYNKNRQGRFISYRLIPLLSISEI